MSTFIKFLLAGGTAALVNIISRYLLNLFMPFEYAIVFAYLLGMTTAFILNKLFVFDEANGKTTEEIFRFIIVNLFALVVVWGTSVLLAKYIFPAIGWTYYPEDIAHIIGVFSTVVTSYFGHKYFTFKN